MQAIKKSKTIRLYMRLTLFKNGKVVHDSTLQIKSRLLNSKHLNSTAEWDSGRLRVTYNRKLDYWNEFTFTTIEELKERLTADTQLELVKEFVG